MAGNVWGWFNDWYSDGYYAQSPYSNPTGPAEGYYRGLRGGGRGNGSYELRVANRRGDLYPGYQTSNIGFRCAADPGK